MQPLTSRVNIPFAEYLDRSKSACSLGQNRLSANTFRDVFGEILDCLSIMVFSMVLGVFVYLGAIM